MSGKKLQDNNCAKEQTLPINEQKNSKIGESESQPVDEVVAGVFCSKRRTGQFNDRFETGELEFSQVFKTDITPESTNDRPIPTDNWTDCVVHDLVRQEFDVMDDILEWPADYDETSEQF